MFVLFFITKITKIFLDFSVFYKLSFGVDVPVLYLRDTLLKLSSAFCHI